MARNSVLEIFDDPRNWMHAQDERMWLRRQDLPIGEPFGKLRHSQDSHILQRFRKLSVGSHIPEIWGKMGFCVS